jgi:hypothetical protein
MSGIFISYRREDSAAHAGRLYDRLSAHFGADQVFMDVDDISPGADFASHIDAKVGACDAMVVVIGKNWLTVRNGQGQLRLSDPNDIVGLEVAMALQRGVLVIPILVGGAQMPQATELRTDLRGLAGRNAVSIDDRDFQRDADRLVGALETAMKSRKRAEDRGGAAGRAELRKKLLRRLVWKVPIIVLLIAFAVWWEWRSQPAKDVGFQASATALTGAWTGEVTYGWGARYNETFFLQPEGNKLFGTVSFLGAKRGIEEGKIESETIAFFVRYEEASHGATRERKNYYWGKLSGQEIVMRMQDDRGSPPVEWVLKKDTSPR